MINEPRMPPSGDQAQQLIAAVNEALSQPGTSYRDHSPVPLIGTAPPVPQPGVPPMSQRATDISRVMIAAGVATVPPGLIAIGLLIASGHANPTVVGMFCAAPAALAVPILALARLFRSAKEAEPDVQQHNYSGPVYQDQRNVHTSTRGVWAKTTNQQ